MSYVSLCLPGLVYTTQGVVAAKRSDNGCADVHRPASEPFASRFLQGAKPSNVNDSSV